LPTVPLTMISFTMVSVPRGSSFLADSNSAFIFVDSPLLSVFFDLVVLLFLPKFFLVPQVLFAILINPLSTFFFFIHT